MGAYPSPQKIYEVVIGALPESNPWWAVWDDPHGENFEPDNVPDNWAITGRIWDPTSAKEGAETMPFCINYPSLLGALQILGDRNEHNSDIMEAIFTTLENEVDPDFDAESADVVCQMAALGEVPFG